MSQGFKTYEEAFSCAQKGANDRGMSHGIEKNPSPYGEWVVFMLPQVRNRCGHELRCQVVMPMISPEKIAWGYEGAGTDRGGPW